jgi:hypothetical protein
MAALYRSLPRYRVESVSRDDGGPEGKLRTLPQNNISSFAFRGAHFFLLALLFCLPGTTALRGQEIGYRIEDDGRFVQILNWDAQEYVLYYGVEIEKQAGETWGESLTGKTEDIFLEISLEPGIYRYRVRAYDFLERPGLASDWIQFEILPARQPELFRFSPDGFYLDENAAWVMTLSGKNLSEGTEIFLEGPQGNRIQPVKIRVEQPLNEAQVTFKYGLDMGTYVIHVRNPGGLTTEIQGFRVAFKKPVDINVAAGYRPLLPLYGRINELFGMVFFPLGAYNRLSIIPIKQRWGYVGLELEPSWNRIKVRGDVYELQAQMPGAAIYGLYRRWFAGRVMSLDFRLGGGIYSLVDYHLTFEGGGKSNPILVLIPAIVSGASLQWHGTESFFIEAGLDFSHFFTVDNPSPGYLRPFAGLGWQF